MVVARNLTTDSMTISLVPDNSRVLTNRGLVAMVLLLARVEWLFWVLLPVSTVHVLWVRAAVKVALRDFSSARHLGMR